MEQDKRAAATLRLLKIMDELRAKCPWDRRQTFKSLRMNTIEETYELADAILDRNMEGIREELGDLMLHIVFYSKLGAEAGAFDYADVVDGLCDKLIYRHPHVYGDIHADTPDDVKRNWEALKLRKKNRRSGTLGGVPVSLPAMVKALRKRGRLAPVRLEMQGDAPEIRKLLEQKLKLTSQQTYTCSCPLVLKYAYQQIHRAAISGAPLPWNPWIPYKVLCKPQVHGAVCSLFSLREHHSQKAYHLTLA